MLVAPVVLQFACHVRRLHCPVVAERHLDEQCLLEVIRKLHSISDDRRRFHVEHDNIGFHPRRDASDLVFQIHGMRRSARCDVVGVTSGKGIAVELRGLVCLVQGCKDGERGAGAEIGAKTDANRPLLLYRALDMKKPLPRKKLDVGQCAIAEPVRCIVLSSSSVKWMP